MTTNTLDEATIARTIRSSVRVLGLYDTDAELLEAMPNSAACVCAGFALASRGGEREAAREALTKCAEMGDGYTTTRVWFGDTSSGMASVSVGVIVREFRDREYPAPQEARRVKCCICKQEGADLSTGQHTSRDECIEALASAVEALAGEGK